MNISKSILSFILQVSDEKPVEYSKNILNLNKDIEETKAKNFIKTQKNVDKNRYYNFCSLVFAQNGKVILKENEIDGFLLCKIDYGTSINYIAGKNTKLKYDDFYKEFEEPFNDYFLIFIKVSYGESSGHLMDYKSGKHYNFTRVVFHNGKVIEQRAWRKPIPLISPYNELLWETGYSNIYKVRDENTIYIDGKDYLNVKDLLDFNEHINECCIFENDYVLLYFYKRECLAFYMVYELCKNADSFEIIPNKFEDDIDTVNYCAKFSKNRIEEIALVHYCIDKRGLGNNAYFSNLYGSKSKGFGCAGSAIYNVPYAEYLKGLNWILNYKSQFMFSENQKNNFKSLVKFIYDKYGLKPDYTKLPSDFTRNLVLEDDFLNKLNTFVHSTFYKDKEIKVQKDILRQKYQNLKQKLIKNKIYSTKWKSEMDLFKLIYSYFPDAIYQYRETWLGLQSLDIYIPSQKLAFEYQGQQHYAPIEVWGGEEGFKHRQKLDEQKRKLCKENNIKLIEWRYDEPISKIMLDKKLTNI